MARHDDWSRDNGATALRHHAPEVASTVDRLVAAVPSLGDGSLVARTRELCGRTLSLPPLPAPDVSGAPADGGEAARVPLEFAEQFGVDVSMIDDTMRAALAANLGDRTGTFIQSLYTADWVPRLRAGLDALFDGDASAWGVPGEWDTEGQPWPLIQRTLVGVARLRELDPVTTEVVRLYQARQHNCRLCKSLRNRTALLAGGDEAVYAEIDDYRAGGLSPRHRAAVGLAEELTWQPGRLDPQTIDAVREHFSPAESVELVLDMMRNSCNKISVSTGTDQANVTDGVEIYDVNPDGSVDFGLVLPG